MILTEEELVGGQLTQQGAVPLCFTFLIVSTAECVEG